MTDNPMLATSPWDEDRGWRAACLAHWGMPKTVDLRRFARECQRIDGSFSVRRLVRLLEGLPDQPLVREVSVAKEQDLGVVWFSLLGQMPLGRKPQVVLKVQAQILLTCQRCMQPLTHTVNESVLFDVVRQESALSDVIDAEPIDPDTPEELVADPRFDVEQLIEDQLILAVPYVPKHENCTAAALPAQEEPETPQVSLFGSLAAFKGR